MLSFLLFASALLSSFPLPTVSASSSSLASLSVGVEHRNENVNRLLSEVADAAAEVKQILIDEEGLNLNGRPVSIPEELVEIIESIESRQHTKPRRINFGHRRSPARTHLRHHRPRPSLPEEGGVWKGPKKEKKPHHSIPVPAPIPAPVPVPVPAVPILVPTPTPTPYPTVPHDVQFAWRVVYDAFPKDYFGGSAQAEVFLNMNADDAAKAAAAGAGTAGGPIVPNLAADLFIWDGDHSKSKVVSSGSITGTLQDLHLITGDPTDPQLSLNQVVVVITGDAVTSWLSTATDAEKTQLKSDIAAGVFTPVVREFEVDGLKRTLKRQIDVPITVVVQ
jgi:hypothetical protein